MERVVEKREGVVKPLRVRCCVGVLLVLWLQVASGYVEFLPALVPNTPGEKESIGGTSKVTYGDITAQTFKKFARTTEDHNCILQGCTLLGEVLDIQRSNVSQYDKDTLEVLKDSGGDKKSGGSREVQFSHAPSGGILLREVDLERWFMMYQFESNPGVMYRILVRLENDTDLASRVTVPVSFAKEGGLWKPRVATLSPRGSMLGSEGIGPDAHSLEKVDCLQDRKRVDCLKDQDEDTFFDVMDFMRYFKRDPEALKKEGKLALGQEGIPGFKPYRYGYAYDVSLELNQDDRVVDNVRKLYTAGRVGANGIVMMQDGQTIYMSGGRGGLFRYEDDSGSKLSSGTIYAAVIEANSNEASLKIAPGTKFKIAWIKLGSSSADELAELVSDSSDLNFSDIFDTEKLKGSCSNGFKFAKVGSRVECLRVKDEKLAAVFEPERFAAIKGATTSIFQFSQFATRLDSDKFFVGAQAIDEGELLKAKTTNTVNVAPNKCGCVFEATLTGGGFVATELEAIMCGNSETGTDEMNGCSPERVANPRSLTFVNHFNTLLVGEDSPHHQNNFVWSYDVEARKPVRIFHAAKEGRITSLTWFQDVAGGNNYVGLTIANPFDKFAWLSYFGSFNLVSKGKFTFSGVHVPYDSGKQGLSIGFNKIVVGESELIDSFTSIFESGDRLPFTGSKGKFTTIGEVVDSRQNPVDKYNPGPVRPLRTSEKEVVHKLGFTSLMEVCEKFYTVTAVDALPAPSYVITMKDTPKGLTAMSALPIDWAEFSGLWRSGGGTVTPWNTHLGGEIQEPDGVDFNGFQCLTGFSSCFKSRSPAAFEASLAFARYKGVYLEDLDNKFANLMNVFNPYHYGYAYEVRINKGGCAKPNKLMTLGRFSHGSTVIMPDQRTVYMLDATSGRKSGGGFFKFVSHDKGDLNGGSLYAAKFRGKIGSLDSFGISWIKLGRATNDELVKASKSIKFSDMIDFVPASKTCQGTLDFVNVKSTVECIGIREGMEKWAAFFETRRFAALKGASVELANAKGLAYDDDNNRLLMSFNRITARDKIMVQDDNDASSNDIKVNLAPCGAIYSLGLDESDFNVKSMNKIYLGTNDFGTIGDNQCDLESISFPGDMDVIPGHGQVLVSEDSCISDIRGGVACGHVNSALWTLNSKANLRFADMNRILTAPSLSSISSKWYPDMSQKSYITSTVNRIGSSEKSARDGGDLTATFGYTGPFLNEVADMRRPQLKVPRVCYQATERGDTCPFISRKRGN